MGRSDLNSKLSEEVEMVGGIKVWELIAIAVGAMMVLILSIMSLCLAMASRRKRWIRSRAEAMDQSKLVFLHQNMVAMAEVELDLQKQKQQKRWKQSSASSSNMSSSCSHGCEEPEYVVVLQQPVPPSPSPSPDSPPSPSSSSTSPSPSPPSPSPPSSSPSPSPPSPSPSPAPSPSPSLPQFGLCTTYHNWFTLREMQDATHGFSDSLILGQGGYGIVYKGLLPDGSTIAVKNLLINPAHHNINSDSNYNMCERERGFDAELRAIAHASHENLVRFLGYCKEGTHRMLVYEYVDNGSLEQWLHGPSAVMSWENRMKIMIGTARALAYLHEALEPRVVHRDVKSSNILVDSRWNAKLSDFGLAKLLPTGAAHVATRVLGTLGYVAPEYASTGLLDERCDTYSFGIVLLETISGRDPVDYTRPAEEVKLVEWAASMAGRAQCERVLDPRLRGQDGRPSAREVERTARIALGCAHPEPGKRPTMSQVVAQLLAAPPAID